MNQANIPAEGCPVTEAELEAIARYSRRRLTAEEVYTFPLVLCDNDLDRDHECFTDAALEKLAVLFCGKTGIFDHDPRGEKQTARIYRCAVEALTDAITALTLRGDFPCGVTGLEWAETGFDRGCGAFARRGLLKVCCALAEAPEEEDEA